MPGVINSTCGRPTILNFSGRDAHPMAGVPINAGLARCKDQVVDSVHRIETRRLLGVPVVEPDVSQLPPLHKVGIASSVVDIERRRHRVDDDLLDAAQSLAGRSAAP